MCRGYLYILWLIEHDLIASDLCSLGKEAHNVLTGEGLYKNYIL